MWEYEHSIETTANPEALWQHWTDMATWPQWNAGVETIDVEGPFEVGTAFTMTPPGDEPIRMRLVEVELGRSFTDEMDAGDFVVRTEHRLEPRGRRPDQDRLSHADHRREGGSRRPAARPGDHRRLPGRARRPGQARGRLGHAA